MGNSKHTCCALLAVLAISAAFAASQSNETAIPEINSSILVFGPSDYVLTGNTSRCQEIVHNALTFNQSRLMFVPTAFWVNLNYSQLTSVNSQVRPLLLSEEAGVDQRMHDEPFALGVTQLQTPALSSVWGCQCVAPQ